MAPNVSRYAYFVAQERPPCYEPLRTIGCRGQVVVSLHQMKHIVLNVGFPNKPSMKRFD